MLGTDQQIDFWRERVERDPGDYISYTELAAAFLRRARETGDVDSYSRAGTALDRALALNPKYESALGYMSSLTFARHDFDGALEAARNIYATSPRSAHALAVIGDASLELGLYAEAGAAYDSLFKLSQSPPVYSRLAHLAALEGQPQKAIEFANQAVVQADEEESAQESRAWYHLQLGHLYFATGDLRSAEEQYDASLDAFPGYVHAQAGLARGYAARGDYDDAISLYQDVIARQPVVEYVVALGEVYGAAGDRGAEHRQYSLVEAIDSLYKANGINTDLETALFFADHDMRLDEAVAQARAVYESRPGSIRAADVLSWALYRSGQYEEALTHSREALRLGTQDSLLLFHAGMIEYRLGDHDDAREHLDRALDINPGFSLLHGGEAARTLKELQALVRN
jgi:tetratricopeptide (TPR) repeat protein